MTYPSESLLPDTTTLPSAGPSVSLDTQSITTAGVSPVYVPAAVDGHAVVPGAGTYIHVRNGSGGLVSVTLVTPLVVDGVLSVDDRVVFISAGAEAMIAVPDVLYRNPVTGFAAIIYSDVTSVTVGCFQI